MPVLEGKTVLCADDDLEILSLVTRHVRSLGATVLEASDGEEALATAPRQWVEFDVALKALRKLRTDIPEPEEGIDQEGWLGRSSIGHV